LELVNRTKKDEKKPTEIGWFLISAYGVRINFAA
jgi:hypothetical protein